jgi:hypothetical protein
MSENTQFSGNAAEMINAWTRLQTQLWRGWFDAAAGQYGPSRDERFTGPTVLLEALVDQVFSAQAEWNRMYFSAMRGADSPLPSFWNQWWKQAEYFVASCTAAQQASAKAWFGALRLLASQAPSAPAEPGAGLVGAWWDAAAKTWQIQNEWLKALGATGQRTAERPPPASESSASASAEPQPVPGARQKPAARGPT